MQLGLTPMVFAFTNYHYGPLRDAVAQDNNLSIQLIDSLVLKLAVIMLLRGGSISLRAECEEAAAVEGAVITDFSPLMCNIEYLADQVLVHMANVLPLSETDYIKPISLQYFMGTIVIHIELRLRNDR